ncbi:hypothetical protein IMCC3317_33010 [Kordia antarctica]|uniref:TonB-dependent receptor SusC n=1 Tax=Kordia antarctica TaxID=1218801 RepID=A0A7L4ZMI0_9FLAO|nr:hypothetical protein [Kordia antarctica]QHI37918.1 hypothetical protein IMCC3317_33010 [Kordia antarctica]
MSLTSFLLSILLFFPFINQEVAINGVVKNNNGEPLPNILVTVLSKNKNMLAYQYSDSEGKFNFTLKDVNSAVYIKASSLFFEEKEVEIDTTKDIILTLNPKVEVLDEVVITSSNYAKDTLNLDIRKYNLKKTESIESSLKKIPGISIDKDGRIRYWNKEIEKILIDGDDLADDQYTFISKNLRSEVLEDIQVLKNFEENTVLKKSRKSDKIALNLKIKEEFKSVWFGNVSLGYGNGLGNDDELKTSSNIGLLRKKIKFLNAQKFSSLGDESIPVFFGESEYEKSNAAIYNLKSIDVALPNEVTNFTDAFGNTFLINKKIKKLVLRSTNFIGIDKQKQESFRSTDFFFQDEDSFTEINRNRDRKTLFFGEIELKNPELKNSYFINKLKYKIGANKFSSFSLFDTDETNDDSKNNEVAFYNYLQYTQRFKKGVIINSELNFGISNLDEKTTINSQDVSSVIQSASPINQRVEKQFKFIDFKTDATFLLTKKLKGKLQLNYKNNNERFNIGLNPVITLYSNNVAFSRSEFIIKPSFIYNVSRKVKWKGHVSTNFFSLNNVNKVLFNYNTMLSLKFWGTLDLSFSQRQNFASNQNFLLNYYITNNNTFRRGGLLFEPLNYDQLRMKWIHKNRKNTFNNEFSFTYKKTKSSLLDEFSLVDNVNFNNTFLILRDGEEYVFKNQFIFLVNSLGFKLETSHSLLYTPLVNEGTELNELYFGLYSFEITSYFSSSLNFNAKFEYNKNVQTFNDTKSTFDTRNLILELNWDFTKALALKVNGGIYELNENIYNIFNVSLDYVPENKKFSYNLRMNNVLNEDEFSYQNRNSFFTSVTTIPLVPLYTFASVKYIF